MTRHCSLLPTWLVTITVTPFLNMHPAGSSLSSLSSGRHISRPMPRDHTVFMWRLGIVITTDSLAPIEVEKYSCRLTPTTGDRRLLTNGRTSSTQVRNFSCTWSHLLHLVVRRKCLLMSCLLSTSIVDSFQLWLRPLHLEMILGIRQELPLSSRRLLTRGFWFKKVAFFCFAHGLFRSMIAVPLLVIRSSFMMFCVLPIQETVSCV